MALFLDYLESFNRKERFFLLGWALGKPAFELDEKFRSELKAVVDMEVPANALAFMDYHLDWIHACAHMASVQPGSDGLYSNVPEVLTGNQEDIDLVVAFEDGNVVRLIMIEAKAETAWTNKQLASKVKRLRRIFGEDGTEVPGVDPVFVLTSPRQSRHLITAGWPAWLCPVTCPNGLTTPRWIALPPLKNRRQAIRWNRSLNKPDADGKEFKVESLHID